MKYIGIIPARYASTRFPGKPLADMKGKTMIQRVYEKVVTLFDETIVATDDERIFKVIESFGGRVVMTSIDHKSGTDRCFEAYQLSGSKADIIVNIQGDEPFIDPSQIQQIKDCFLDPQTEIATLVKPFPQRSTWEELSNPNTPKVIFSPLYYALYFSRSVIPYARGKESDQWSSIHTYYKHIGIYAYRNRVLEQITHLPPSDLEQIESLEQLRWIENGYKIKVAITQIQTIGIDTPQDMEKALQYL